MRITVRRFLPVFMAASVVFGLAGCGDAPIAGSAAPLPSDIAQVQPSWSSCAAANANEDPAATPVHQLPRLDADFVPAAVVVCYETIERRADGGRDLVAIEARGSDPAQVAALATAVRLPDEPPLRGTEVACTMEAKLVSWFALVDSAGRWVHPGVPVGACGKIRGEVWEAVSGLTLTRVSAHPVREFESAAAAAAGCSQGWKDMVWVTGQHRASRRPADRDDPWAKAARLRLCVYRVPGSEQGSANPAGTFERGGILPADRGAALAAALRESAPASACTAPAGRFAVILPDSKAGGRVHVELDGCQRVLVESINGRTRLEKADATLIALLVQA